MSSFLTMADAVAAHLQTVAELDGIDILVDRQKNLDVEISKRIAGAKGAVVTILWVGGKVPNPKAKILAFDNALSIAVRTLPILRDGMTAADDLVEIIAKAIHHFNPNPDGPNACRRRVEVIGAELSPDPKHLVYEIAATANLVAN